MPKKKQLSRAVLLTTLTFSLTLLHRLGDAFSRVEVPWQNVQTHARTPVASILEVCACLA